MLDDTFVRRAVLTAVHVRRHLPLYVIGVAILPRRRRRTDGHDPQWDGSVQQVASGGAAGGVYPNNGGTTSGSAGRSFQDARLFPGLTVKETISVAVGERFFAPGALHAMLGLPDVREAEVAIDGAVEEAIGLLGLGAFRDKFTAELSTGSRRLVELAVMVAQRPKVLLLDEPSAGIAQREAEALAPVLREVQRHLDCSILIIEHDMSLMRSVADRLVALDTGAVVTTGSADEVLAHPQVVASYLGTTGEDLVPEQPRPRRRRAPARTR